MSLKWRSAEEAVVQRLPGLLRRIWRRATLSATRASWREDRRRLRAAMRAREQAEQRHVLPGRKRLGDPGGPRAVSYRQQEREETARKAVAKAAAAFEDSGGAAAHQKEEHRPPPPSGEIRGRRGALPMTAWDMSFGTGAAGAAAVSPIDVIPPEEFEAQLASMEYRPVQSLTACLESGQTVDPGAEGRAAESARLAAVDVEHEAGGPVALTAAVAAAVKGLGPGDPAARARARAVARAAASPSMPSLFRNPMQDLDYRLYESMLKATFIGPLFRAMIKYLVGQGFRPELELIHPDEDDAQKNQKEIDAHQDIVKEMLAIDDYIDAGSSGREQDVSFQSKVAAMVSSMLAYNRGALLFDWDPPEGTIDWGGSADTTTTTTADPSFGSGDGEDPYKPRQDFEYGGKTYPAVPHNLIFAHAKDLGMIEINPRNRKLRAVQWKHGADRVPVTDMIYAWNVADAAAIHNAWHYGMSVLTPLIPPAKIMRQIVSDDFPAITTAVWARMYLLVVKNEGNLPESKRAEYEALTRSIQPGRPSVLIKNPDDVNLFDLEYDPKIGDLMQLLQGMITLTIAMLGLPQAGFHDEAAANRATMAGKLELTKVINIEPLRRELSRPLEEQWYNRWFRMMHADDKELLSKFRIKVSWNDIEVAEWYDVVQAVMQLDKRAQLKNSAFGELTGLDNYPNMIEPNAEVNPGGEQQQQPGEEGAGMPGQGGGKGGGGGAGAPGASLGQPGGISGGGGGQQSSSSSSQPKPQGRNALGSGGAPKPGRSGRLAGRRGGGQRPKSSPPQAK